MTRARKSEQLGLTLRYPSRPGRRRTASSRAAADHVEPHAERVRELVFAEIKQRGMMGATADEVAAALGISILTVRPRCSELRKLGRIEPSGFRRPNASGIRAIAWVVC